jgi:perosamine synthetase
MHKLPMFMNCPRMDLSGAESLDRRIINIPSSAWLGPCAH